MDPVQQKFSAQNAELAGIFRQMASCYRYLGTEERFRASAYENAAKMIADMDEDISIYAKDVATLDKLQGIGESIAQKIIEYLETGKIRAHEKLIKQIPVQLLELMEINGFGPATIRVLHEKLNVNNRNDLARALEEGKLARLKGFGAKKIENMKRGLKLYKETHTRMPLNEAIRTGNEILGDIEKIPGVQKASLAGSLRRKKETVGDIDIVVIAAEKNWKKIIKKFISLPAVSRVLASGGTRGSVLLKKNNTQVDIRLVHDYEYGSAMLYFTGSKEHNLQLRMFAREKGYKINEYGLFDVKTGKRLAGDTEESIYAILGTRYIPPEKRLGAGEIEKSFTREPQEI